MTRYKVTCLSCGNGNIVTVYQAENGGFMIDLDTDHHKSNQIAIISGRYRKDMKFGWECRCGNDSRLARQEFSEIKQLVIGGGSNTIEKITQSLTEEDADKFKMEPL